MYMFHQLGDQLNCQLEEVYLAILILSETSNASSMYI